MTACVPIPSAPLGAGSLRPARSGYAGGLSFKSLFAILQVIIHCMWSHHKQARAIKKPSRAMLDYEKGAYPWLRLNPLRLNPLPLIPNIWIGCACFRISALYTRIEQDAGQAVSPFRRRLRYGRLARSAALSLPGCITAIPMPMRSSWDLIQLAGGALLLFRKSALLGDGHVLIRN